MKTKLPEHGGSRYTAILMHNWSNKPARHTYQSALSVWHTCTHTHSVDCIANDRSHLSTRKAASERGRKRRSASPKCIWRTVRSNHFHEINWFHFAVCRPMSVCVRPPIISPIQLDGGMWYRPMSLNQLEWNFFIKKKHTRRIKMRDKEKGKRRGTYFCPPSSSPAHDQIGMRSFAQNRMTFYGFVSLVAVVVAMNMNMRRDDALITVADRRNVLAKPKYLFKAQLNSIR